MRKPILVLSTLALGMTAAVADPVEDRQAIMKERGSIAGKLVKVVKGQADFDAAAVLKQLQALEANAEKLDIDVMFPAGSDQGKTSASPKIWEDMAGFKADNDKYVADVKAAVATAPADVNALKAQFGKLGEDCGSCHQTYRVKKG